MLGHTCSLSANHVNLTRIFPLVMIGVIRGYETRLLR